MRTAQRAVFPSCAVCADIMTASSTETIVRPMGVFSNPRVATLWIAALVLFIIAMLPPLVFGIHADQTDGLATLIEWFVRDSVDAPDNWALAIQRSAYFVMLFA